MDDDDIFGGLFDSFSRVFFIVFFRFLLSLFFSVSYLYDLIMSKKVYRAVQTTMWNGITARRGKCLVLSG